jgi:predicted dehydrogenase
MNGPPEKAFASGGRFTRPEDSEMWDAMHVDYHYPDERIVSFTCRQWPGSKTDVDNVFYGQNGTAYIYAFNRGSRIVDQDGKELFSMPGNLGAAYKQEHKDLVDSINGGKPIVELMQTANSSMMAVMGRMSAYTGQEVSWDFVTEQSKLDTFKHNLTMDSSIESEGFAVPGTTQLT